jgi:hypothetical protein
VLTGGSDCNPATTSQSPQTSAEPQPTTAEPNQKPTTAITTPKKQSVNIKGNIGNEEQLLFTTYEQGKSEIVDTIYLKENQ